MSKIIHHSDDDGRCAAAIVYRDFCIDNVTDDDCFEYTHGGSIDVDEEKIRDGEKIFIVDLALDDVILDVIRLFTKHNCHITHIDHHQTTIDRMQRLSSEESDLMSHVNHFYHIGLSATMLTWIYSCMYEEERLIAEDMMQDRIDFTDGFTHFAINVGAPEQREYKIPLAVKYIDDFDVWRHSSPETMYFHLAFGMEWDKRPTSKLWSNTIYCYDGSIIEKYVNPGRVIYRYKTSQDKHVMKHAFESKIWDGDRLITCLCLNYVGNSTVFGDQIKEYPMVCLFHFDGDMCKWCYSLYSDESSDVDVAKICERYGGGGHKHAAGFQTGQRHEIFTS